MRRVDRIRFMGQRRRSNVSNPFGKNGFETPQRRRPRLFAQTGTRITITNSNNVRGLLVRVLFFYFYRVKVHFYSTVDAINSFVH